MVRLEELRAGQRVSGLQGQASVELTSVRLFGTEVAEVTFRTPVGALAERMLYREDEALLSFESVRMWDFSADAEHAKLALEAHRISLASLFDPYLATRTSAVQPLPHQILAVYQEMLPRLPLRYVLADDPGAGKTIMTGLLVKEMLARGDVSRCLVVVPGSLCEQWQDELSSKFGLAFRILTNDVFEGALTRNAFNENDLCIARLDKLARDESVQALLKESSWDLVVVDEAHKMSASVSGNKTKFTKRYRLGRLLGTLTENLLLLTATPHNGKPREFCKFMELVDPDRFSAESGVSSMPDVSDVMRRLVKEDLLKFDGTPLFPERRAQTLSYDLSPLEQRLYDEVTSYVREGFARADALEGGRRTSVGFALTSLQRRLASSPEAIFRSLERRRRKLQGRLEDALRDGLRSTDAVPVRAQDAAVPEDYDPDELTGEEQERHDDEVTDTATAAATIAELQAEIGELGALVELARRVRSSGQDRKWEELSRLLQDNDEMFGPCGRREKLIIFTEHTDTLRYLAQRVGSLLGRPETVLTIQGGMRRDARRDAERRFTQDADVVVLIATDAAGEGINLQRAHLMVNYDLPWNPNRLEQRFGRIHRIGQTEVCFLWNLVASQTREGEVYQRLLSKLEAEREALGGRVFDVLGRLTFGNASLRDLLLEAVRYGDRPDVRARLNERVDSSLDQDALRALIAEYALTAETMGLSSVLEVKRDMELAAARRLEPHFLGAFFLKALRALGGRAAKREEGRYEITRVPQCVRDAAPREVLARYERVCFDRACADAHPRAELLCPGHPLMDALVGAVESAWGLLLDQGCALVDETDWGDVPRLMFCAELAVADGTQARDGSPRVVAREARFVEVTPDGQARPAGYAPYLDYRAPSEEERAAIEAYVEEECPFGREARSQALGLAARELVPEHLREVTARRRGQVDRARAAVDARLRDEVRYWDRCAAELRDAQAQGHAGARGMTAETAQANAEKMSARRARRLALLDAEASTYALPPRVTGGSLVVPRGLLARLMGRSAPSEGTLAARRVVEAAAMSAVLRAERAAGNEPQDVSSQNVGYDVRSLVGGEAARTGVATRFIEVKGRAAGATTVTVSRNELLCALNNPDSFVLALVEVRLDASGVPAGTKTTYLRRPFAKEPDAATASVSFDIARLMRDAQVEDIREEA